MRVCHKTMTHPHLFIGYLIHLISYSSDYAEESEHSCSTDYARNLNGFGLTAIGASAVTMSYSVPASRGNATTVRSSFRLNSVRNP